jgi:peptide/nickel transport system ATP-binding protein
MALACKPKLLIADEPTTALDVTIQAQILDLMGDLKRRTGAAIVLITHDLEHMTHLVAVMYLGKIVEVAPKHRIFASPKHPYTLALLSAVPVPEPGAARHRIILKGDVPSPINPPKGCRFNTRCPYAFDRCRNKEPPLRSLGEGQLSACHLHDLPSAQNPLAAGTYSPN